VSALDELEALANKYAVVPGGPLLTLVEQAKAEQERLQRGAKTLGEIVDRQCRDVLDITGAHDLINEDGDGDWGAVWDRLHGMRAERDAARAEVERLRAMTDWHPQSAVGALKMIEAERERDAAVARAEAAEAKVERVRAVHVVDARPTSEHYYCEPSDCDQAGDGELRAHCDECRQWWPCATIRALDLDDTRDTPAGRERGGEG
jgi:hypothetical protein